MNRRWLLKRLGLAPAAVLAPPLRMVRAEWVAVPCPSCKRDVCFLPSQRRRNVCAWDRTVVTRGLE